ncbi:MAG TPA: CDGSH iron-sulfur domain-containing protein [Oligoflexia bacterium]|nr:CDGSH iron-sulfur domain-containing protein [Oligoflexia bacterium]HMP49174.1 CDGSH iron-sulfur domain-containing protein [Oligoflexia bacterium]
MSTAKIAGTKSIPLELEPGVYYYCTCGESLNQPFCDGSHKGSDFQPLEFTITEKKKYAFCACKTTAKAPFCDGAHKKLC